MAKILLIVHVLVAIVAVGPVAVAASMFPAAVRRARAASSRGTPADVRILHRICRVYAALGILVPFFGLATAGSMHVLGDAWLIVSIVLTAFAAAVLALLVLPRQAALLADLETAGNTEPAEPTAEPAIKPADATAEAARRTVRLAMYTGTFNLLWAAVTVLMIVRPGSTTGA